MAVLYNVVQRQVQLRANQLAADNATDLATWYSSAVPGQAGLGTRAIEFPFVAINDAILNAGDTMVRAIGNNPESPYRNFFADVTSSLASGALLPTSSSTSKPIVGIIANVRDASNPNRKHKLAPYQVVEDYNVLKTNLLKVNPYLFYTDNVRIYHTSTNIIADVVIWSKTDQTTLLESTPARGTCPFPEELIECLVCGALSYIFRGDFNIAQISTWRGYFNDCVSKL